MQIYTTQLKRKFRLHKRHCGSVIVEFALILPMLLLLTFGILQYGIIMNASNSLTQISREGARFAALNPSDDDKIKTRIQAVCSTTPIKYSDLKIDINPPLAAARTSGTAVTVTVTYPMSKKVFLPKKLFGANIFASDMAQSSTFLVEGATTTTQ